MNRPRVGFVEECWEGFCNPYCAFLCEKGSVRDGRTWVSPFEAINAHLIKSDG